MFASFVVAVALALLVSGTPLHKRQEARVIMHCAQPNTAALTFDDGPWNYLYDIVNTLSAADAIGTFFFNGNNYDCIYNPDAVKGVQYAYGKGHQIASHTWSHKDLTTLSWDQINEEMERVEQAFTRIVGVVPAFMRPPYGTYNSLVRQAAFTHGEVLVTWDLDSGDSVGATAAHSEAVYDEVISRHPSNILTINHETHETTAHQVLPYAIQKLKAAGYQLVSVAECVGLPPYQKVVAPSRPDSTWHC